jgi:hypothetical protein
MLHCICCRIALTGGIDTYGDLDLPMCQSCYLDLLCEWKDSYVPMFECTHYPDGSIGCRMTDEWKAIEDGLETAMAALS